MPHVRPGMSRNEYVGMCVNYVMKNEGLDKNAAVGKCEGLYDEYLKNKHKGKANEEIMNSLAYEILKQKNKDA
jgi:hypothetical protein